MADLDLNIELGPQFTIEVVHNQSLPATVDAPFTVSIDKPIKQQFTLVAGVKSSSLFANGGGSNSTTVDVSITTALAIGAFRAITIDGVYCEQTAISLSKYAGVSKTAVGLGEVTKVAKSGLISERSWTWVPDSPIYVGVNGVLTQTPSALPIRRIGWAISATQINLDPFPIIGA